MIPTAEEVLVKNNVFKEPKIGSFNLIIHRDAYVFAQENIKRAMIEFAKMHVAEALKAASEKVQITDYGYSIDTNSILNSYPESNIK